MPHRALLQRDHRWVLLTALALAAHVVAAPMRAQGSAPPASRPATGQAPRPEQALRVLFIGNSYTYYHNLPAIMAGLAAGASPNRTVQVAMEVEGGATLEQHWLRGRALQRIEDEPWDVVVLQEQSMLGVTLVEGAPAINAPETFHRYARLFDRAIRRRGARTVLFSTWSRRHAPREHQQALDAAYTALGRDLGARVAPVGATWQRVRAARPGLDLYDPDGSHPSPAGSYLAATVLWGVIGDAAPTALPPLVRGRPVADLATGAGLADSLATLVALPDSDATLVQAHAATVLAEARSAGGFLPVAPSAPLALSLPAGEALPAHALSGRWAGRMRLYDDPVDVTLQLTVSNGTLQGEWTEAYGPGRGRLTLPLAELRIEGAVLHFTLADPRFLAPPVRHRAVLRAQTLEGVAEVGPGVQLPRLLGRWSLRRR